MLLPDQLHLQSFPNNDLVGHFIQLKARVVRITEPKLCEKRREYVCSKCANEIIVDAEYVRSYIFDPPRQCDQCKGKIHQLSSGPKAAYCSDYQEIRVQVRTNAKIVHYVNLIFYYNFAIIGIKHREYAPSIAMCYA